MLARPNTRLFWIGLPFVIAGEAIRVWSAGYLTKLRKLVTAGPFALCRNPLYVGSFLTAVGYFTFAGRIEIWIAGIALFWLFHGGAIAYEERLLRRIYKEEFAAYCRATPRLIPKFRWPWIRKSRTSEESRRGDEDSAIGFSFQQVLANDEQRTAIKTALLTTLFGIMAYYPHLAPARWLFR